MGIFSFLSKNSNNQNMVEPNYDRFSATEDLVWTNIKFAPIRYEIWRGGQKIKFGKVSNPVTVRLDENGSGYQGLGQLILNHTEKNLSDVLDQVVSFDMCGAQGNRRILFTVPTTTNARCTGMYSLQQRWPHSRYNYNFNTTEPYCCSVFTVQGRVVKMAFHLDNPDTMVELYGF